MYTRTVHAVFINIILTGLLAVSGCTDVPKGFEKSIKLVDQKGEHLKSPFLLTVDNRDTMFVFDRLAGDKNVLYSHFVSVILN